MATDWSDNIVICDLGDEPDLSDELNDVHARITERAGATPNLVLNLASVTYLNSSNIAQLLRLRKAIAEAHKKMRICAVSDPVWSVMLLTGLDKVFDFQPDKATAIASLQIDG